MKDNRQPYHIRARGNFLYIEDRRGEDKQIFRFINRSRAYTVADRSDAGIMKDAQVMRYWAGYDDMNGCIVDLRVER